MEAYRFRNLVYVPIPKHASRTYVHFFKNVLGWQRIETYHINWHEDKVFAHLLNPITRYASGTAQVLTQNNLEHLIDSPDFAKLISTATCFDQHTYPIAIMLPLELCYKMEWLMLDHNLVTGEELTQAFLKSHGVEIDITDIQRLNQSSSAKKGVAQKIKNLIEINNGLNSLIFVLQEDLNLYHQVNIHTRFHEIKSSSWNEISYLTNYVEKYEYENLKKTRFNSQL